MNVGGEVLAGQEENDLLQIVRGIILRSVLATMVDES